MGEQIQAIRGMNDVLPGALVRRDGSAHLLIDNDGRVSAAAPRLAHGN